jgi:hypothetical protein
MVSRITQADKINVFQEQTELTVKEVVAVSPQGFHP